MASRPPPYLDGPTFSRWSLVPWLLAVLLVLLKDRLPPFRWERTVTVLGGLALVVNAFDGIRTGDAHLSLSVWIHFSAIRWERPVRFWVLTLASLAAGLLLLFAGVFGPDD